MNDSDGSLYDLIISKCKLKKPKRNRLAKALQYLAGYVGEGLTTESTIAVGYADQKLYVAKLGRVTPPSTQVGDVENLLSSPLDAETEETLSVFEDSDLCPVSDVVGVGGGKTGLHAEMMILRHLAGGNDVLPTSFTITIAASQGACPACAGYMNYKGVGHTGVRANGRVSSRWIHPLNQTVCGSEVGLGLQFHDQVITGEYKWLG